MYKQSLIREDRVLTKLVWGDGSLSLSDLRVRVYGWAHYEPFVYRSCEGRMCKRAFVSLVHYVVLVIFSACWRTNSGDTEYYCHKLNYSLLADKTVSNQTAVGIQLLSKLFIVEFS